MDYNEYNRLIVLAEDNDYLGLYKISIEYYKQAFEIKKEIADWLNYALVLTEIGNVGEAIEIIDEVIKSREDEAIGYYFRGIYYARLEIYDESIKDFNIALLKKDFPKDIYCRMGYIYNELYYKKNNKEFVEKAIKYYLKSIDEKVEIFCSYFNISCLYESENDLEKALYYIECAHNTDSSKPQVSYNMGVIYTSLGENDKARDCYLEEITKDDFYKYALYNLGVAYLTIYNDYEKAKYYFLLSLDYIQDDGNIWYNLGCTYIKLGDMNEALQVFYKAVKLNDLLLDSIRKDKDTIIFIENGYLDKLVKML